MPWGRSSIGRGAVGPERLADDVVYGRYFFDTFGMEPSASKKGAIAAAPAGTSLQEQWFDTGRYRFEYTFLGDATDAFVPVLATEGGYNWGALATLTLDRGVEICFGGTTVGHPRNYRVGTDEDWFLRCLWIFDDVSGIDLTVGFKKAATPVATLTEVTDIVGVRVLGDSSSGLGALSVVSNLNNGGTSDYTSTAIDTGSLTDAQYIELEVVLTGRSQRFYVNGIRKADSAAISLDSGDSMAPICRLIQTTDICDQPKLLAAEGGPLRARREPLLKDIAFATA